MGEKSTVSTRPSIEPESLNLEPSSSVPVINTNLPDFDTLRSMPGCCGSSYLPLKLGVGARLSPKLGVNASPAEPLPLTTNTSWPLVPQLGAHGRAMAAEGIEATAAARPTRSRAARRDTGAVGILSASVAERHRAAAITSL